MSDTPDAPPTKPDPNAIAHAYAGGQSVAVEAIAAELRKVLRWWLKMNTSRAETMLDVTGAAIMIIVSEHLTGLEFGVELAVNANALSAASHLQAQRARFDTDLLKQLDADRQHRRESYERQQRNEEAMRRAVPDELKAMFGLGSDKGGGTPPTSH